MITKLNKFLRAFGRQKWIGYIFVILTATRLMAAPILQAAAQDRNFADYNHLALSAVNNPGNLEETEEINKSSLQNGLFIQTPCLPPECDPSPAPNPKTQKVEPVQNRKIVTVTAYSSTPDQTDDSPFITANGTYVRDGIIACNFLPFGTEVKFPEVYGDKIFTVHDRMAKKHNDKMDIWMASRADALKFGVKKLTYEVVK